MTANGFSSAASESSPLQDGPIPAAPAVEAASTSTADTSSNPTPPPGPGGSVSLLPDKPAPQLVGEQITWTAKATDSGDNPVFQFSVGLTGGALQVVRDFSSHNNFTWAPMQEGTYNVQVVVKDGFMGTVTASTVVADTVNSRVTGTNPVITPTANPLVALYSAPPTSASAMHVNFRPAADPNAPWVSTDTKPCLPGLSTNFLVAGMLPNTTYEMVSVTSQGSSAVWYFTTGSLPASLKFAEFTVGQTPGAGSDLYQNMVFHMAIGNANNAVNVLATDLAGRVEWYYDPVTSGLNSTFATSLVPGGTILVLDGTTDLVLKEIDLAGNTLRETNVDALNAQLKARGGPPIRYNLHHDAQRLPDGKTAILADTEKKVVVNGTHAAYVGDLVLVLDQNFQVTWTWNSFNYLDVNRGPIDESTNPPLVDWLHSNSVAWSPADGDLIVSMRNQDWVIKIDYAYGTGDGHIVWRLGKDGDFSINSSDSYPWFSHQHDVRYIDNTTLVVFDDGNTRIDQQEPDGHSRGQVLSLNEQTRTATLLVNADLGNYSFALGSAQKLPNGNYVFTSGFLGTMPNVYGQSIEVRPDGTIAYVLQISKYEYRSYRMSNLYGYGPTASEATTTTALTSSGNPSSLTQSVTFTATVSPVPPATGLPTGTVTFREGTVVLGVGTLNASGVATFTTATLATGPHAITASYDGDATFAASMSSPLNQTVNKVTTTTTLTSTANPSVPNQLVTFTATITPSSAGSFTAGGTVTFYDGNTPLGTPVPVTAGKAALTTSSLPLGNHPITAVYTGDANFSGSSSVVLTQVVNQPSTIVALSNFPATSMLNQAVTFTATVSPVPPGTGTPTGTVTFRDGTTVLGAATLSSSGVATFTTSTLPGGTHLITATYNGDNTFSASTSPPVNQAVNPLTTSTALASTANPSVRGQAVTLTAMIAPSSAGSFTAGGTVTFYDGSTPLSAPVPVSAGMAALTISSLAAGTHAIKAVYTGDGNFAASSSAVLTQVVNVLPTSIALANSPATSTVNQLVTFTATVTPTTGQGNPTGTVTFLSDGTPFGTAPLINGTATLNSGAVAAGTHGITAAYSGDANFSASTSSVRTQVVNPGATQTTLTGPVNSVRSGQAVTFTATVSSSTPGTSFTPGGTITLFDGARPLGQPVSLNKGTATFTIATLASGVHAITAKYSGDTNYTPSTSPVLSQMVLADQFFALGSSQNKVQVRRTSDGSLVVEFAPFAASYTGAVTVTMGDVNGDGFEDLIVGSASGSAHVKVYDGKALANGTFTAANAESHLLTQFMGFDPKFGVGVNVAAAYVNGSTHANIILGAASGNPQVKVFNTDGIGNGSFDAAHPDANLLTTWFAYGKNFNIGVTVAGGDIEGNGFADVVTGTSSGNPNVKVYSGKAIHNRTFNSMNPDASLVANFFPYATGKGMGVNVAVGDVNGDHFADVITAPTISSPDVRVYDGKAMATGTFSAKNLDASRLDQFFAFDPKYGTGVTLAAADFTGSGRASILTGAASGSPHYRVVDGLNSKGTLPPALNSIDAVLANFKGGIYVGA
jgi:hypothetical protein